jgi:hypothetical protein
MMVRFFVAGDRAAVDLREEPVNKIPIWHFALINIAAVSSVVISAPIASAGRGSCFRR